MTLFRIMCAIVVAIATVQLIRATSGSGFGPNSGGSTSVSRGTGFSSSAWAINNPASAGAGYAYHRESGVAGAPRYFYGQGTYKGEYRPGDRRR
jgi:phage-related minor tail protein